MHAHQKTSDPVVTIGIDIGKNTFHLVGLDKRGAIDMRIKVSRNQLVRRLVNLPPCLVGLEAGSGSHHVARQIQSLGHDVRSRTIGRCAGRRMMATSACSVFRRITASATRSTSRAGSFPASTSPRRVVRYQHDGTVTVIGRFLQWQEA